jgi:hypothetical protein
VALNLIDAKFGRDLADLALKTLHAQREYFYSKGDRTKLSKAKDYERLLERLCREMIVMCGGME